MTKVQPFFKIKQLYSETNIQPFLLLNKFQIMLANFEDLKFSFCRIAFKNKDFNGTQKKSNITCI